MTWCSFILRFMCGVFPVDGTSIVLVAANDNEKQQP